MLDPPQYASLSFYMRKRDSVNNECLLCLESQSTGDQKTSNIKLRFVRVVSLIRFAKSILALLQYLQLLHYKRNAYF